VRLFAGTESVTAKAFDDVKAQIEVFHPLSLAESGGRAGGSGVGIEN